MASGLLSRVTNFAQLPLLYKATVNDETTIPGSTLTEIKRVAFESSSSLQFIQDFLLQKVGSSGCFSRAKCLRITKYLIDHGPLEFTINLRRKAAPIEQCKVFTGPLDPLHGDALYVGVRKQATELLESLYDDNLDAQRRMNTAPSPYATAGSGTGMGGGGGGMSGGAGAGSSSSSGMIGIAGPSGQSSSSYSNTPSSSTQYNADGSKKMWGFGNAPMPQEDNSLLGQLKSKAADVVDTLSQQINAKQGGGNSGGLLSSGSGSYSSNMTSSYSAGRYDATSYDNESPSERSAGRPGGGWDNSSGSVATRASPTRSLPVSTSSSSSSTAAVAEPVMERQSSRGQSTPTPMSSTSPTSTASRAEDRLVGEFTVVVGVRAAPSRDQVQQFLQRCKRLNMAAVVDLLLDTLQSSTSQVQIRCLCLLEELYNNGVGGVSDVIVEEAGDVLHHISQNSQGAVHSKASKLLRQVNPSLSQAAVPNAATSSATSSAPSSTQVQSGGETSAFGDILGLSDVSSASNGTSAITAQPAVDLQQSQMTSAMPAASGASEMFSGMSMGGVLGNTVPLTQQVQPAAMTSSSQANGAVSLMAGMTIASPAPAVPSAHLQSNPAVQASMPAGGQFSGGDLMAGNEVDPFDPLKGLTTGSQPSQAAASSSQDLMFSQPASQQPTATRTGMMAMNPGMGRMPQGQGQAGMMSWQMQQAPAQSMSGIGGGVGMTTAGMTTGRSMSAMPPPAMGSMGMAANQQQQHTAVASSSTAPGVSSGAASMYMGPTGRTQVQLARQADSNNDGFSFLSPGKKAGAFDFVQDAMKAEKK